MRTLWRMFRAAAIGAATLAAMGVVAVALVYFSFYTSREDFNADVDDYLRAGRIYLFNKGYVHNLSQEDVRRVYERSCYKKCHGEAAMITAILPPSGWIQVVERMRMKERVEISGKEADLIIKYMEEKYPTTKSAYSYETRKKIHEAVWRNDMGQGDIYCDVIFVTPEYLKSIGAEQLREEYKLEEYDMFIVSFTVHEGELDTSDLDKIAFITTPAGRFSSVPPWSLRFQTADKHHYEANVRFKKVSGGSAPPPWMEMILERVGGPKERRYRWDLPLNYPPEIKQDGGQNT